MFCPLCQEEYRDGFSTCNNCHLALVATRSEAEAKNAQLWTGTDQHQLDEILSVLDSAGIPRYYKEELSPVPRIQLFTMVPVRPVFKLQVRVLKDDLPRAQIAIQHLQNEDDAAASTDVLPWLIKRKWVLSFLLAIASFFGLIFLAVDDPGRQLDYFIQGAVFRTGVYVGRLFYRGDAIPALFGAAADVLTLMVFWFAVIWVIHRLRAEKQDATMQNNS